MTVFYTFWVIFRFPEHVLSPWVLIFCFSLRTIITLNEGEKMDSISDRLREIIVNICDDEYSDISSDEFMKLDIFDDLALDSIAFITMIVEIENEFDVQIPNELMGVSDLRNVYRIESILKVLLKDKEADKQNE